jgi:hypothetical protein
MAELERLAITVLSELAPMVKAAVAEGHAPRVDL